MSYYWVVVSSLLSLITQREGEVLIECIRCSNRGCFFFTLGLNVRWHKSNCCTIIKQTSWVCLQESRSLWLTFMKTEVLKTWQCPSHPRERGSFFYGSLWAFCFFLFRFQVLLRLFEGLCQKIAYQKDMVSYFHILRPLYGHSLSFIPSRFN